MDIYLPPPPDKQAGKMHALCSVPNRTVASVVEPLHCPKFRTILNDPSVCPQNRRSLRGPQTPPLNSPRIQTSGRTGGVRTGVTRAYWLGCSGRGAFDNIMIHKSCDCRGSFRPLNSCYTKFSGAQTNNPNHEFLIVARDQEAVSIQDRIARSRP